MQASLVLLPGLLACFACATAPRDSSAPAPSEPASSREVYLSPAGFQADLITHDGIHVKTNGQYKSAAARTSASRTIDRYWREVQSCASREMISIVEVRDFPKHLSIEISDDWRIVEGPRSHLKMQAFPSSATPGAFVTAHREESALYIEVVPELKGLPQQMAGELNLWLGGSTSATAGDLSSKCASLPCFRFDYDNAPSQAWDACTD